VTDGDILSLLNVERPTKHRILVDLKPSDRSKVSLYRLRDVWGYSADNWTPLALRLEGLLIDKRRDNPSRFKQAFVGPIETKDFVYEFLYLNGGTKAENGPGGLLDE